MKTTFCGDLLVAALLFSAATGAESPAGGDEQAAILKASDDYIAAVNRGDAGAIAAAWTADGDYIDAFGNRTPARELVQSVGPQGGEAGERLPLKIDDLTIRLIRPDVAIEDGCSQVDLPGGRGLTRTRYTAVWVKQQGRWLLDSVREAPAQEKAAEETPLKSLEWMLGNWTTRAGDLQIRVHCHWVEDERFLQREFTVNRGKEIVLHATQTIAYDPAADEIKSWTFDSRGGHGEATWSHDGQQWVIDTTTVLADGREVQSTSKLRQNDDGSVTWTVLRPEAADPKLRETEMRFTREG
jgi:uncharacterized protein (TIGR02246 family)